MKGNDIVQRAGNLVSKAKFGLKKNSPEILIVFGVVGVVTGTVMACRATRKVDDILEDHAEKMDVIHEKAKECEDQHGIKKETAKVYFHTGAAIARLYGPAIGLEVLSISSIVASNNILRKRNIAITAAYAAVDKSFKEYRSRVVQRFGSEVDHQLRYNMTSEEIEETTTDSKGKEKTVKKTVEIADPNAESMYFKYFTRSNPFWENDPSHLEFFFRSQQNYANDRLKSLGHVTLNEVYEWLGFQRTKPGMVVGWIYDEKNPVGDNFVEFDIKKVVLPTEDGRYEDAYAIDFNVDGNIYSEMI